ncbi:hypothetical protein OEZ49_22865, partial [Ruegeria sp. WL0004]|nr:hypothetical protein [Ruegeria sp. WL0004]
MADFFVFATFDSVWSNGTLTTDFVRSRQVDTSPRDATITDGDGTLSLNESTAFTYTGLSGGDVGPYDMHSFTMNNGGTAIWMAGVGNSGGIVIPTNAIAYDTFSNGTAFTISSSATITSTTYATFYVPPANNDPTVTGAPTDVTVTEDTTSNLDLSTISFVDADGDNLTVTLQASSGTLSGSSGGGVTVSNVGARTLTLSGSASAINTFLDTASNVRYLGASNANGNDVATLTVSASDGNGGGLASNPVINIDITAVNDAPTITNLNGNSINYIEGFTTTNVDVLADSTVTDVDSANFNGGSVQVVFLSGGLPEDRLSIANAGFNAGQTGLIGSTVYANGIAIGTFAGGTAGTPPLTVSLNSNATPGNVQVLLRNILYQNLGGDDPSTTTRTIGITVNDGSDSSASQQVTLNITAVNDAPIFAGTGGTTTYSENGAPVDLFSVTSASTVESGQQLLVTLTVSGLLDGAAELLTIDGSKVALTNGNSATTANNGLGVSVSVTTGTATVSISGAALATNARQILDTLAFEVSGDAPTAGDRVFAITSLMDSGGTANGGTDTTAPSINSTVTVTAVNDAPEVSGAPTDVSVTEDT